MLETLRRIVSMTGRYKKKVLLGFLFATLKSFSMAAMYMGVFYVVISLDDLSMDIVKTALVIEIFSVLGRFVFQWLMDIYVTGAGYDIFMDYRLDIGEKIRKAPMGYFSENKLGELQSVLTTVFGSLENYGMFTACNIVAAFSMSLFMIVMFFIYSWPIALISFLGLILGGLILKILAKRAAENTMILEKVQEDMISDIMEYTRGIGVLRSHVNGENGQKKVTLSFDKKEEADYNQEKAMASILRIYQMTYKLSAGLMVMMSSIMYWSGSITKLEAIVYMIASFFVYSELESLGDSTFLSMRINNQLKMIERIVNIPEMSVSDNPLEFSNADISFENVSFAYDESPVIKNVNMKIRKNSRVAIVGPSGGGKSTLCKLIPRFWDVSSGRILIGNTDIKDFDNDSLMNNISMVFQNVYLFHDTVKRNIAFGLDNASDMEIVEASKKARCHDFIMSLPEGYDTIIGEGGSSLSGGEKQRISIARAILKDAPIIILDEATASIDPENEAMIMEAIDELTNNKTVITIAHKLATIRNADKIFVLEDGQIVQDGLHESLVNNEGVYKRFMNAIEKSESWSIGQSF